MKDNTGIDWHSEGFDDGLQMGLTPGAVIAPPSTPDLDALADYMQGVVEGQECAENLLDH